MPKRMKRRIKDLRGFNKALPGNASRFPPNGDRAFSERLRRAQMMHRLIESGLKGGQR